MTIYFTGSTFNQVIHDTIESMDEMIVDPHVEDHQDFYKYIKQNIASLQGMDQLVIDCTAVLNTDEELLAAFEMIRTMYDGIRIIIFARYLNSDYRLLPRISTDHPFSEEAKHL